MMPTTSLPKATPTTKPSWFRRLQKPSSHIFEQFVRYIGASGMALGVDFVGLFLLKEMLGLHYLAASGISFACGSITKYLISVLWVFDHRQVDNRWLEFFAFVGIGGIGFVINLRLMYLFTEVFYFHYLLSKIGSAGFVFVASFLARKFFLFRKG